MKLQIFIFIFCLMSSFLSAQDAYDIYIQFRSQNFKKGKITMNNGNIYDYSNLSIRGDSAFFFHQNSVMERVIFNNINEITCTESYIGKGAMIGTGVGLFAGILISGLVHPARTTEEWIEDQIGGENERKITKEQLPLFAGITVGAAALGTLIGAITKKEKLLYQNKIDVFPELNLTSYSQSSFCMTVRININ